jgi:hypothetical protein
MLTPAKKGERMQEIEKVYVVQRGDGLIKIGYSSSVERRLDQLRRSHEPLLVIKVVNGDRKREQAIHHKLREHREYGEWFRPHSDVLALISDLDDSDATRRMMSDAQLAFEEEIETLKSQTIEPEDELGFMDKIIAIRTKLASLRDARATIQ